MYTHETSVEHILDFFICGSHDLPVGQISNAIWVFVFDCVWLWSVFWQFHLRLLMEYFISFQVLFCRLTQEQRELYQQYLDSSEVQAILAGNYKVCVVFVWCGVITGIFGILKD